VPLNLRILSKSIGHTFVCCYHRWKYFVIGWAKIWHNRTFRPRWRRTKWTPVRPRLRSFLRGDRIFPEFRPLPAEAPSCKKYN
jgi:hypothetical protein